MASGNHDGSRALRDRFDTRARDMLFPATADAEGRPTCERRHRMRPEATARIDLDDPLRGDHPQARDPARGPGERDVLGR